MKQAEPLDILGVPLPGVTLIEASAGTGKTYTLAALYVRLLLEQELSVDQILVVTYTRAATAELRMRIRSRIGQTLDALSNGVTGDDALLQAMCERARESGQAKHLCGLLSQALAEIDRAAIYTIHGFCQRVLQRHPFESGAAFDAELSEDQSLLLEEVVSDFWAARLEQADAAFVSTAARHKLNIASLLRFVHRALPNPDLTLLPAAVARDRQALTHAYAQQRERAAQLWAADRKLLTQLLLNSGLTRQSFAEKHVLDSYAPTLDKLARLSAGELPEWLVRLTPAGLKKACTKNGRVPEHAFFAACDDLLDAAAQLKEAESAVLHAFMRELLEYARAELQRRAEARGVMTFDDLLMRVHKALRGPRGPRLTEVLRNTYKAALIDEFQDTDPLQLEVFRNIYAPAAPSGSGSGLRPALFLIGDPKQAIYAFRGADIFAYLSAAQQDIDRVCTLEVSYRSDPKLLAAVARLFTAAARPFVFDDIDFRPVQARPGAQAALAGPALEFLWFAREPAANKPIAKGDAEAQLPERIAAEIASLLNAQTAVNGKPVQPGQIAVLCRTNAQAGAVQSALRALNIPAVLDGDASVFDSAMAEELGRWLWAMAEPGDSARIRAALASAGVGLSADDLLELERDEAKWDDWVTRFHQYQQIWQTRGFLSALHALCDDQGVAQRLLRLPDGERRYTDLWHLAELLHGQEQQTHLGPHGLLHFYRRVREGSAQREGMALEDVQVRLESDAHAVTLTTIHKSKGLEYPIVYCPYLWVSSGLSMNDKASILFHDREDADRSKLVLPGAKAELERAEPPATLEALAEGARLLYVALTRAKHRLYVVWGGLKGFEESALGFVLHQGSNANDADAARLRVKELAKATDQELCAALAPLLAAEPDALALRPLLHARDAQPYERAAPRSEELAARKAKFPAGPPARVGSFSGLIEREDWRSAGPSLEPEPIDRDAQARESDVLGSELSDSAPRVPMAELPAGASFGHLIHGIYERADFAVESAQALRPLVALCTTEFGGDVVWEDTLSTALFDSLHTPLSAAGGELPSLAVVPKAKRLNELEFVFPVADGAEQGALSPQNLGQLLAAHARDDEERAYASQLGRLRFLPLRGFLRGFLDLALEHGGRFYILDYKSNRLGETVAEYQRPRMVAEMRRHHYVLQYLLYTVALHRYLGLRMSGYDYDQHFGGVYYLFVRGMSTQHPPGSGVLFERPPRALIEALSECLRRPEVLS
jgi:exodeoxyribonuclease V beta subunit